MSYITDICFLLLAVVFIIGARRVRKLEELVEELRDARITHAYEENKVRERFSARVSDLEAAVEAYAAEFEERIGKDVADVTEFCERRIDSLVEDIRALQLWKIEASELIEAHAELEKEAANSERMFQEGLSNLLNYGVGKE
jgi:hypothetical protein